MAKVLSFKKAAKKGAAKKSKKLTLNRERAWQDYQGLVKWVSNSIASKCRNFVSAEDLISVGTIGLLKAMDRYDPKKKAQFRTYAVIKIRGEILDYIRKNYPRPVSQQLKARDYTKALEELQTRLKRKPTIEEIASALDVTVDEAHEMGDMTKQIQFVEWDQASERSPSGSSDFSALTQNATNVVSQISRNQLRDRLQEVLDAMPKRVQEVIQLLYFEDRSQIEVAEMLNLSPSRVSQLHSEGISLLQENLNYQQVEDCLKVA